MDRITASQFKSWKNEEVGKVFFKWISANIKEEKLKLETISKNPLGYSQEDYFKRCMECGVNIRLFDAILNAKINFIQESEEEVEDEQTEGSK
jgi:hypothetical protein